MPQVINSNGKYIVVAQADPQTGTVSETHTGQATEKEGPENPVTEHSAYYYMGMGWLAMAIVIVFCFVTTRNLTTRTPSRGQALAEQCVASIRHFCRNAIGPGGEEFAPLIGTLFAFILVSNLFGIIPLVVNKTHSGFASLTPAPTANLSMTFALGIMMFLYSQYIGIKRNGVGRHFGHMAGPIPALAWLIFPIELVGTLVRPVSLAMRLFGNVFGEETVIAVLLGMSATLLPVFVPIPFQFPMLMFGVFGSIVQAGVFTILTCAYISLSIGDHGDHGHGHEEHDAVAHAH